MGQETQNLTQNLVEAKYVHKIKPENVLLANLRRALPTHVAKSVWEREIAAAEGILTAEEIKILRSYYVLHEEQAPEKQESQPVEKSAEGAYYLLLNVPHFIDKGLIEEQNQFSKAEIETLKRFYSFSSKKDCYVLNKSVQDIDEIQILTILQRKDICMSENEKYKLSTIMEKLPGMPKENVFYANMVLDLTHPFFFDHATEHLPGLMIIEAARQFMISQLHKFNNMPFDTCMILNKFSGSFQAYLDMHHPIRLKGTISSIIFNKKEGYPSFCEMKIDIIQSDSIAANVVIAGQAISNRLFVKLRRTLPKESEKARYFPNNSFFNRVTIRRNGSDWNKIIKLINVSIHGFCVEMEKSFSAGECKEPFDFIMCFEDVGFIFGKCRIAWQMEEGSRYYAGVEIKDLTIKDRDQLYEAIKRYCYVIEEREIL